MSESSWWYLKDGQRHGPVTGDELLAKRAANHLAADTLVWSEGMESWYPFDRVDISTANLGSAAVMAPTPPPAPTVQAAAPNLSAPEPPAVPSSYAPAGPWTRFFARMLDIYLHAMLFVFFVIVVSVLVSVLFFDEGYYDEMGNLVSSSRFLAYTDNLESLEYLEGLQNASEIWAYIGGNIGYYLADNVITIFFALLIEVAVMSWWGNTLGKRLFGVRLRHADGSKLSEGQLFKRNIKIWIKGFGFGVPLVMPFTFFANYLKLRRQEPCAWDIAATSKVDSKPVGPSRFGVGVFFVLLFVFGLHGTEAKEVSIRLWKAGERLYATTQPMSWTNPLTNKSARLSRDWVARDDALPATETVFGFERQQTAVFLGREMVRNTDLDTYVALLRNRNRFGTLQTQGDIQAAHEPRVVTLSFQKADAGDADARVDVHAWMTEPGIFWRTVAYSLIGDDPGRDEALAVAKALRESTFPDPPEQ
ncbi:MAG: hypothetical protein Tsb0016_03040 [Sphingomonadales bacterium]